MKILLFGRGTIATQYGWAFEKAGHTVEFYVRPGRAAQYGSSVRLDLLDARRNHRGEPVQETWPVVLRETLPPDHDFDLIVVSVTHGAFASAVEFLAPRVGGATVLAFNNLWTDPKLAVAALPAGQVVWGFPGAGGGYNAAGVLRGGLLKTVFFGTLGTPLTNRDREVRALFTSAGFSVSEQKNFGDWLWHHFIVDAGFGSEALKAGGTEALMSSPAHLKGIVLDVRELLPVLKARGARLSLLATLPFLLPPGFFGYVMKRVFTPGSFYREITLRGSESAATSAEMRVYALDALDEARKWGIHVPRLEGIEELMKR
jgi:2-dehydropantoate 2-reductase